MTPDELADEINLVAEYARLPERYAATARAGSAPNTAVVTFGGSEYAVDLSWAVGNIRRLPDRTSAGQIAEALLASHPDVRAAGPKHPPR